MADKEYMQEIFFNIIRNATQAIAEAHRSKDESIINIIQLIDSSYLFIGTTDSYDGDVSGNHGGFDYWVIKTDKWGNLLWQKCYGGSADETPTFIQCLSDGNFILGGHTYSNDGDVKNNHSFSGYADMWLIKISPFGNLIWSHCFGGTDNETMHEAIELSGNRLLLIGGSYTSNNTGDVQCNHHGPGSDDMWLVMVYDSTMVGINEQRNLSDILAVYPNPANDYVKFSCIAKDNIFGIRIRLANQIGQVIKELTIPAMINEVKWDTSIIPAGIYFYFYTSGNILRTGKVIVIKS